MTQSTDAQKFEQIVRRFDRQSKLLRFWPLQGGISAQVTALEIELANGTTLKTVARLYGAIDLQNNPKIARDEFNLLFRLHGTSIPVPQPYIFEDEGIVCGTPFIVIEYVEGTTEFAPPNLDDILRQCAITLAEIHRSDEVSYLNYLPQQHTRQTAKLSQRPAQLDESLSEGRIRDALEVVWPLPAINSSALLHGDYWSGNLLWNDGKLAAVLDWEDAALGDPLADLGNTRLEMLWAFGLNAMQRFTNEYQSALPHLDYTHLPYWDLCAALRPASRIGTWGLDAATEQKMRADHQLFITQAFDALSSH